MRWSIVLPCPSLVVRPWQAALTPETLEHSVVLRLGPDADGRRADVAIEAGPAGLRVAVLAAGGLPGGSPCPEWFYRDHLVLHLDPAHDHATRELYVVADNLPEVQCSAHWSAPGETPADQLSWQLPSAPAARGGFARLDDGRRWYWLELPRAAAWWQNGAPVGLQIKVGFGEPTVARPLVWPPSPEWAPDAPLAFGDAYLSTPDVLPTALEAVEPAWGGEASTLRLRVRLSANAPRGGRVHVRTELPGEAPVAQSAAWAAPVGDEATLDIPVVFPHRGKWSSNLLQTARLGLALEGPDAHRFWSAGFPFGFDCGIIVRDRYGRAAGAPLPPYPAAHDPAFIDRQRAYFLARLPAYRRRTTREGAPSDFYLDDPEGRDPLDLMDPAALDRAAAMLARRFPEWPRALCALALWAYHPLITTHSASWSRVAGAAAHGTLMRLDGCFCSDVARLVAAAAEKIGARLGVPLTGYTIGLRGHLATLVDTPQGQVVVDGMLGHWYPSRDRSRLATIEEMRTDPDIVGQMWYQPRAHGHEFYYGIRDHIVQRWKEGPLVYPTPTA